MFNQPFLKLSMQTILTILLDAFENLSDCMEQKTSRLAWSKFLDRTVFHYIQCLLASASKIRQQYPAEVIDKIKADQEHIKDRFVTMMSQRACNLGVEVLDDLTSFFECSPEFISVPCEKLRRTQGKQFNNKVVAALMALRTDLERPERKQAIQICEEIIKNFKDDKNTAKKGGDKNQGLFAIVEQQAEQQKKAKGKEEEKKGGAPANNFVLTDSEDMSDEDEMNMSDFMREGGLQDDIEEQKKQKKEDEAKKKKEQMAEEDK